MALRIEDMPKNEIVLEFSITIDITLKSSEQLESKDIELTVGDAKIRTMPASPALFPVEFSVKVLIRHLLVTRCHWKLFVCLACFSQYHYSIEAYLPLK